GYLELIRNTPMLVQLYLFYFVLAPIIGIDRYTTGILCIAVFEGAFASEIFRAGILSVPKGQWEASDGLGMHRIDTLRFIILPQAIRLMIPPTTGLVISLIKHSSIVSVIAIGELTTKGRDIISETYMSFEVWFTVAAMYLVLTVTLSIFAGHLERRYNVSDRW
ncbi:MAG: amino acid ABC transporter permease, partial [Geminicoccaceae bacterium]